MYEPYQSVGGSSIFKFHPSVPPCLGSQPPNPELKDLMHLQVSNWYRLGLSLGLNSHHLDVIKRDHQGDTESQTCKMFDRWLRTQPDASYEQLIKALRKVGDESVANFLSKEYGKYMASFFVKLLLNYTANGDELSTYIFSIQSY